MVYLDNAATSFPKPRAVREEQDRCMRLYCGNPGRSSHPIAMRAAEVIYDCRAELAALMGSNSPENVIFTSNATSAINLALKGLLRHGDHVLLSDVEHNAVFRPLARLARDGRITYDRFPSFAVARDRSPERILAAIASLIRPNTRLLVCTHASNICSVSMPIREIGAFCRARGILFVVDASQSAGHLPIDMAEMCIDALCLPGHKGLFGPPGVGALLLGDGVFADTLTEGGSGVNSLDDAMPEESPERYEAGTLPVPAIAGLGAGIRLVRSIGLDEIAAREQMLSSYLFERLSSIRGLEILLPHAVGPILLCHAHRLSSDRLGSALGERGICVRSGFHCAPLAHQTLSTPADGAVRLSLSYFNTKSDIDSAVRALKEII